MKAVRLKTVARVAVSNVDKKFVEGQRPVGLCNYTDVYYNDNITTSIDFMPASASEDQFRDFSIREGDVLITKDSETPDDIGIPAYVAEDLPDIVCGYHLALIRPDHNRVVPKFLFWLLAAADSRSRLSSEANGITRFGLRSESFGNILVPTLPLPVQRAIADYLDAETTRIDALIEKKRRMIELLEERFAEFTATAVTHGLSASEPRREGPAWVRQSPSSWTIWPLGRLVRMVSGGTPDKANELFWKGEIPWASPKDMKRPRLSDTEDHISEEAVTAGGLKLIPANTVLIVVRGMILAHSFPVAITAAPMTINQDMKALLPLRIQPEFLAYLLIGLKSVMLSFVEEAAHGTRKLTTEAFAKLPVAVPSAAEQSSIVLELEKAAEHLRSTTSRLMRQIELFTEHRQALITAAVTGQLVIPGVAA